MKIKEIISKYKNSLIWVFFITSIILGFIQLITNKFTYTPNSKLAIFSSIILISLLTVHACTTLKIKKAAFFLSLGIVCGFISEYLGLKYGVVFGGSYNYNRQNFELIIKDVPVLVLLFWSFFIYTGYTITTSFLVFLNINKPSHLNNKLLQILPLSLLDALLVMAIDLTMDPLMVLSGNWTWPNGGLYFDIPIGNFIGWFFVAFVATGIFRLIEFYFPEDNHSFDKRLLLIPVIGYGALSILFAVYTINLKMPQLALISLASMMPIIIINLIIYHNRKII